MNHVEVKRRQIQAFAQMLGIITLIILGRAIGDNGIAYLAAAAECMTFLFMLLSGCVPDTLGRMLRNRNSKSQFKNAARTRRNVMIFQAVVAVLGGLFLFLGADLLAVNIFKVPYAALVMRVMAPALLIRIITSVILGYFQGNGTQMPTVAVSVLRQVLWLGLGILFCRLFEGYGEKVSGLLRNDSFRAMYGAVGIAAAMVVTELLLAVFLTVLYLGSGRGNSKKQEGLKATDSFFGAVSALYGGMSSSILLELLYRLPLWMGIIFYQKSVKDIYLSAWDYGAYYGKYVVVCAFPALLYGALMLPLAARTVGNLRREEHRYAREVFGAAFQTGVVNSLFGAVALAVLANQASGAFFDTHVELAASMIRCGSSIILFAVLAVFFMRILLMTGKGHLVMCSFGAYAIIFIVGASVCLNALHQGIMALVWAGLAAQAVLCAMLGFFAFRQMRVKVDIVHSVAIPVAAAGVMGTACLFLGKALSPHIGNLASFVFCLIVGAALYWILLLLLRCFKEQQLNLVPGGSLIVKLGQLLRVM